MAEALYTMSDQWQKKPKRLQMSGGALKIYGCAAAVFYTLGRAVIQNGILHIADYSPEQLTAALEGDEQLMMLSAWSSMFQFIGALSIPVFAFLLVEGFLHTASLRRYILTLIVCAVVSEVPYDLAMNGKIWDFSGQNVMFTYVLGLIMLYGLRMLSGRKGVLFRVGQGCIVVASALWSMLLQSLFGLPTLVLAAVYYLLYEKKAARVLVGCAVSIPYVTAPLSGLFIWCYNGKRGKMLERREWVKYVFYALYPAHLLVLWLAARAVG